MYLPKTGIKILYLGYIAFLCSIIFACSNTSFSGIQNIRQIEKPVETLDSAKLTLMTFNIRAGGGAKNPGMSPKFVMATEESLIKIVNAIKSVDPDVVGLQEVRGYNQAKFIAEKLNMNFAYSTHRTQNWWGLAVLSKYKIINIDTKTINFGGNYGDRIALMCDLNFNGKAVSIINVHYALENYNGQVKATIKFFNKANSPFILMGDLNRHPVHSELKTIRDKMIDTCEAENVIGAKVVEMLGTGIGRIDYIFIEPNYFEAIRVGLVEMEHWDASDHIAYWAKIKFKD